MIVTGAGTGLGRAHALYFASLGARVLVNDLGCTVEGDGAKKSAAEQVAAEIRAKGGVAVADCHSCEQGDAIKEAALDAFDQIDAIVCNAGIIRDKMFLRMNEDDWDAVFKVHVKGAFALARAVFPHMKKRGYGRMVFTSSSSGLYGNPGQANYASAKMALIGLSNTLAKEGLEYGIQTNAICPMAATRMTEHLGMASKLKPELVSPFVAYLCHENCTETGGIFEVGAGAITRVRVERTPAVRLTEDGSGKISLDDVHAAWSGLKDWSSPVHVNSVNESMKQLTGTEFPM